MVDVVIGCQCMINDYNMKVLIRRYQYEPFLNEVRSVAPIFLL